MESIAYVASLLLAGTFLVAAAAKARRPPRTEAAFRVLGVPAPGLLARLVPGVEVAVALLLVVLPRVGGAAALATLGAFTTVLWLRLRAGARVRCGCFGSSRAAPLSSVDLVRNGFLVGLALAAWASTGPTRPTVASVVAVTTAAVTALVLLGLLRLRQEVGAVWANRLAGEGAVGRS